MTRSLTQTKSAMLFFYFLDLLIEVKIPDRISNQIHRPEGPLALTLDHNCIRAASGETDKVRLELLVNYGL